MKALQIEAEQDALRAQILHLTEKYAALALAQTPFSPGVTTVAPAAKVLGPAELCSLVDASMDMWLTTGRFNDAFERKLGKWLGVRRVLTTNSGSSANLLAVATLCSSRLGDRALRPGDEVITVAAGFPTTVNPLLLFGLVPVFVDVDPRTYNIDAQQIEDAISDRTRAIVIAHTLGNPFDLDTVVSLARKHDLWLVEDCCDALGSRFRERSKDEVAAGQGSSMRPVGTFGDLATVSFYPAHHITMGEGGAVFTQSPKLARIVESIRDWGRDCNCPPGCENTCGKRFEWQLGGLPHGYDHKYIYSELGFNLKITDMQAAVGLAQLDRLPDFIAARRRNFSGLYARLKELEPFLVLPEATEGSDPAWFGFPLTLREQAGVSRTGLLRFLDQHRIGTRLLFAGNITRQPYFKGRQYRVSGELVNTDRIMNDTFWLGVHPAMTDEMLDFVAEKLGDFFGQGR